MTQRTPTPGEVIRNAIDARLVDVHTALPAKVISYDASTRSVSAQPLIKRVDRDEAGERIVRSLPVVSNVPVAFPGITLPLEKGDTVLLVFAETSLDKWLDRGGEVDPIFDHRFDLSDAIAFPLVYSLRDAPAADSSATVVEAKGGELKLGGQAAVDKVATEATLNAFMTALASAITAAPVANKPALTALQAALQSATWPALHVSNKVKTE